MKKLVLLLISGALFAQKLPEVRLPQYTRTVLPNGTVVLLLPHRGVPLVSVQALIKGGAESDPAGMGGLAAVTAELLRRGTRTRSADQFAEEVDALGASFSAGAGAQTTRVAVEFMNKDADKALDLLADAVLRPAFNEAEVKKTLEQSIDEMRSVKDNPGAAIEPYFRAFFFGADHPYGRFAEGDELSLARITREAISGYHSRLYAGRNLIVIAAGEFEPAAMRASLEKAFGGAPAGTAYEWQKDRAVPAPAKARLLLVDMPDATQTYFMIGNPGIRRTDPDRVAVWLVNTLFGGRFTSMLNDELRVNSGLTYGARSEVDEDRLQGAIAISTYTRTDATVKAMDLALAQVKKLHEQGISAEQLASAKAYVKGTFPTRALETADQLARVLADMEIFGLNRGEVDDLFSRIDAVTVEQANAVARKHFGPGNLVFTLVGSAARIREQVKKYAPELVEVPITRPGFPVAP